MTTMYRARFSNGSSMRAAPNPAYNFGTGDFTVLAMIELRQGGVVVARKSGQGGDDHGGFHLMVRPDGSVMFYTDNGLEAFFAYTLPSPILDGDCHTVGGIRRGAQLAIVVDGLEVPVTTAGKASPLNVNNNLPLTIGWTEQTQPNDQFIGSIMNVSLWNTALSGDRLVSAAFANLSGGEPNLQGYWTLNSTTADLSPHRNAASIVGSVSYEYCLHCAWAQGLNKYMFIHIANMPGGNAPAAGQHATVSHAINVPAGAPAFCTSVMSNGIVPAFPAGAQIKVVDPTGHVYDRDQNVEKVFASVQNGQLWALMVLDPAPGNWKITVTAPSHVGFALYAQTIPVAAVVATSEAALRPIYGAAHPHLTAFARGGFWDLLRVVFVAAIVGLIVAAAAFFVVGATLAAAAVHGLAAFAAVTYAQAKIAAQSIDTTSLPDADRQISGMAGFVIAPEPFLLIDANVDAGADDSNKFIYERRLEKLYPQVMLSSFNKVQVRLIGNQDTRDNVKSELIKMKAGYVTATGHGHSSSLTGWYLNGESGPLQEVITTIGKAKYTPEEVAGKIFHFFACNTGYRGPDGLPGLGRSMVAAGAVGFFGYKEPYSLIRDKETRKYHVEFCDCDIAIDLSLINGKTCGEALAASMALFNSNIERLFQEGWTERASRLRNNRDALVFYGNENARLQTGVRSGPR